MSKGKLRFFDYFGGSDVLPYLQMWEFPQRSLSSMTRWDRAREYYKQKQTPFGAFLLRFITYSERAFQQLFQHAKHWLFYKTNLIKVESAPMRKQTVTEHTLAMAILAGSLVRKINRERDAGLNEVLIVTCALYHDIPEGILKEDVPAIFKTASDDVAEYEAFLRYIFGVSKESQKEMLYAYLLQFAFEFSEEFPDEAKRIMKDIRKKHYNSAVFFYFLEKYDYLKYALEHFMNTEDPGLLLEILDGTKERPGGVFQKFDELVNILPELSVIWSDGFRARCEKFITDARMLES